MRADVAMFLFRQGVHRIFGKHLLVAMLIGFTSRGIDPESDSNAAQDDGLDLSATQLQVQVGAKEGTPLVLGDQVIQGLRSQFWRKLGEHLLDRVGQREDSFGHINHHQGCPGWMQCERCHNTSLLFLNEPYAVSCAF